MAKTIATLAVAVSTNMSRFTRGLRTGEQPLRRFGDQVQATSLRVKSLFAGALSLGAGVGLTALVKQSFASADALGKVSDKLGTATEDLAGLRLAAEFTGNSQQQLDVGLQRMTRRIAEAAQGSGEAKAAIAELGLNAQRLAQLTPTQQFEELAGAFSQVKSQSDKVRLGFKLFDSEGVGLINTLALGKQGLSDVKKEAEQLGLALNRVEVKQIEMANDAFTRVRKTFTGIANQIAVAVAPFVEDLSNRFVNAAKNTRGFGAAAVTVMKTIAYPIAFVADTVKVLELAWDGVVIVFVHGAAIIVKGVALIGTGIQELVNLIPGIEATFASTLDGAAKHLSDLGDLLQVDFTNKINEGFSIPKVSKFFEEVTAKSKKAAREAVKATRANVAAVLPKAAIAAVGKGATSTSAAQRGSVEAFRAIRGHQDALVALREVSKQQLRELQEQNERLSDNRGVLADIRDAIETQEVGV